MPVAFKKCNSCKNAVAAHLFEVGGFICKDCRDKVAKADMDSPKVKELKDEPTR